MRFHVDRLCVTLGATILLSCGGQGPQVQGPETAFALERIQAASDSPPDVNFTLDAAMGEQDYTLSVAGDAVTVTAGGPRGLMYGGLEAAEQLELNSAVADSTGSPFIERRGIKFNIPLDARTPSYDDSGDAAQQNIAEMWNWEFWEEFLDQMALHRYNVISFWNPHPFPSMIELDDYPEVALDDVMVTTLKPVGLENEWGDPQLVTSNVMANLKTVKTISIEEKIAFWRRVMRHARERGIDVYWITWNVAPNSVAQPVEPFYKTFGINMENEQPGKHGITHQMDNPVTVDYHRQAVKQFLLTYPDVTGIGVTAGEHMPKSWEGANREEWLWNTYGQGILDAKAEQPERTVRFIHRVWHSDMDQIMKYWGQYPDPFEVSFKYAHARLFSSPELPFAKDHIAQMKPYGLKSWWNLRNDDIFVFRWGDPDYVRDFLRFFEPDATAGYYEGSDGYVWGREFVSKNPALSGEMEIHKHWYRYMLFGRLGYNDKLDESFFTKKLAQRYPETDASALYRTWATASKIVPAVNVFHWRDWDADWSVEGQIARPKLGGYREVADFIDNPTLEGSGILNPRQFVAGESGDKTPLEVIDELRRLAEETLNGVDELRKPEAGEEFRTLLDDLEAMAHLGRYYAEKIDAAVALARFQKTARNAHRTAAVTRLETAVEYWEDYRRVAESNYKPQMLARSYRLDWTEIAENVKADVGWAKTAPSSWRPPAD